LNHFIIAFGQNFVVKTRSEKQNKIKLDFLSCYDVSIPLFSGTCLKSQSPWPTLTLFQTPGAMRVGTFKCKTGPDPASKARGGRFQ